MPLARIIAATPGDVRGGHRGADVVAGLAEATGAAAFQGDLVDRAGQTEGQPATGSPPPGATTSMPLPVSE